MNIPKKIDTLCHAVDIAPTLLDLIGAPSPQGYEFDGLSLRSLFENPKSSDWVERMLVTDSQRVRDPIKWKQSAVMSQGWRLINGKELYNIESDPGQEQDISGKHSEKVAKMRAFYDAWWANWSQHFPYH